MSTDSSSSKVMKVLFVDDEVEILNALKLQMSLFDEYECLFSQNPLDVTEIIDEQGIDIIVADIVMPEKNGITLFQEIKVTHPNIIRILLTGYGDYNTAIRAINEAEVFGFITKPWEQDYLLEHLKMATTLVQNDYAEIARETTPFAVFAQWNDDETIGEIIHTSNSESLAYEYSKRIFLTASALFGSKYRFQNNLFSLPLKESNIMVRVLLDGKNDNNYGIFIFTKPFDNDDRRHLDNIINRIEESIIKEDGSMSSDLDLQSFLNHLTIQ